MESLGLDDYVSGKTHKDLIKKLPAQVQKLKTHLDYDEKELNRLYGDLSYQFDLDKDYKLNLLDKILRKQAFKDNKKFNFRKLKIQRIRKAIEINNIFVLAEELCLYPNLMDARDVDANSRYELRTMAMQPSASFIRGTIVEFYNQLVEANKEMKQITREIETYLNNVNIQEVLENIERGTDI